MLVMQVPDSWSKLDPLVRNETGAFVGLDAIREIDIGQNQLTGPLPATLSSLDRRLIQLDLDMNSQLSGCIPLTPYTTASFNGTQVVGRCAGKSERDVAHNQQRNAINKHFVPMLKVNVKSDFRSMLQRVASDINRTLGESVQSGQTSKVFLQNNRQGEQRGYCRVSVTLIDGIEYITSIEVGADSDYPAAGLDMQRLLLLMRQLPRLRIFDCTYCYSAALPPTSRSITLPPELPGIAPNLERLGLFNCSIVGKIPASYGDFAQMQELSLGSNALRGQPPAQLSNLRTLKALGLGNNKLTGECYVVSCRYESLSQPSR
jgi:hypothetical protein